MKTNVETPQMAKSGAKRRSAKKGGAKKKSVRRKKAVARKKVAHKRTIAPPKPAVRKHKLPKDSADDPNWLAPSWDDDVLLGAHVSTAGGTHAAPPRARAIGASAMQIFTKMANRWAERACEGQECATFRAALGETRVRDIIAHDSYLINLASPDDALRRRSIESFVAELQRCEALGIAYLVSHPGNFIDDRANGVRRNSDAITEALSRVPGRTILCMETTAGSGTAIGATFDELAELIDAVPEPHRARVGVCVDSCHAYSAGYDFVNDYDGVWRRFDDALGLSRLRVMHLNDSKTPFNSRRDRHELIGEGSLGDIAFRHIMNDERLARVPKVIETPKGADPTATDAKMLARLRGYIASQ
jgi:deoxyribonuclease-4